MADAKAGDVASGRKGPNVAAMQAGAAKARLAKAGRPELTAKQKFMLSNVRQAAKACKLLAETLQIGADISPAAAEACNALSSEYVKAVS